MTNHLNLNIGEKVHYTTASGKHYNGIIKGLVPARVITEVFVVYDCAEMWDAYKEYTGVRTKIKELSPGWIIKLKLKLKL